MSTITEGNPVTLDHRFGLGGQELPDSVTFLIEYPDGSGVSFVSGVDPQVTNPATGYYECALGVLPQVFEYRWSATGSLLGEVTETAYGTVFVIPAADFPSPSTPAGPTLGPALTWITGEDVALCVGFDYGSNPALFDRVAVEASMALFEISGRQFTGLQDRQVRPCRANCPCWGMGPASYGVGPFWWTGSAYGVGGAWAWYNERGDTFGCSPMSKVNLAGYPVRKITEVLVDGAVMTEFDGHGFRNWRLDKSRYLIRMDEPATPPSVSATPRFWPGCQNMSLDSDQPGTFQISYQWGVDPPELGRQAAVEIAIQLWLACNGSSNCLMPAGVTKIERQGITVERELLANWANTKEGVGLVATDLFLQAYNDGMRRGRRSAVWSPDLQSMARRVGNTTGGSGS